MYEKGTERFNQTMDAMSRTFCAKIKVVDKEITSGIKSIKWSGGGNAGDALTIGSTVSATVDVEMKAPDFLLENREIEVYIGLILDGTPEYIPMGKFVVEKPEKSAGNIRYTAHDRMISSCERPYFSNLAYPSDTLSILEEISEKTGILVDTSGLSAITVSEKPEGYTCREIIGYIAGMYGRFACIDRDGRLVFRWYTETMEVDFDRADEPEISEYDFTVHSITCAIDKGTSYSAGSGTMGIQLSNPLMTQADVTRVFGLLEGFSYRPGTVSLRLGDIRLDPWDMVKVTRNGETYMVPCMELTHDFDGGVATTITASGKSETEAEYDYKGPATQAIDRMYTELLLVKDLITNTITVEYLEANYAKIDDLKVIDAQISDLKANQITVDYLKSNFAEIDLANIKDGCITTAMIGTGVIGTTQIADGSITDAKIVGLTANKITAGRLDASEIEVVNLNAANITVGTINGKQISQGTINIGNLAEELQITITDTAEEVKEALKEAGLASDGVIDLGGRVEEIESQKMYRIETCIDGKQIFTTKGQSATMCCRVLSWDEDITETLDASLFTWHRNSDNEEMDAEWDSYHVGMKQIGITTEDVLNNASFYCEVNLE